jgi:hypothetical protein
MPRAGTHARDERLTVKTLVVLGRTGGLRVSGRLKSLVEFVTIEFA